MEKWWHERLTEGTLVYGHDVWHSTVTTDDLFDDYIQWCNKLNITRRDTRNIMGVWLRKVCPVGYPKPTREGTGKRRYGYQFPELEVVREHWCRRYGSTAWPKPNTVEEEVEPF
jgi:hypothetical protein